MPTHPTRWRFSVDESGDFAKPQDSVCVAGVLSPDDGGDAQQVEATLRAVLPCVPWPPHGAHLNHELSAVVWHAVAAEGASWRARKGVEGRVCDRVAAQLRDLDHERWHPLLAAVRAGRTPRLSTLKDFWDELRPSLQRRDHEVLLQVTRDHRAVVGRVFAALRKASRAEPPSRMAYFASDSWLGEPETSGEDRYLGLLRTLLERVWESLEHLGGHHEVWVEVLGRHVADSTIAQDLPLHVRHLGGVLADERVRRAARSGGVRLVPLPIARWEASLDARLVLADLVANRTAKVFEMALPITGCCIELRHRIHMPVTSGAASRPHIAAGPVVADQLGAARGAAFGALDLGRALRALGPPGGPRPWAVEQALLWL